MTLESSLTVLLRIVTNASFCIDNRLRQMAFFVFAKVGKVGFRVMLKDFEINSTNRSSLFRFI